MASTRTAPLRPHKTRSTFDGHPLSALGSDEAVPPGPVAERRPTAPAVPVRGSLQSLDWRQAVGGALVVLGMLAIVVAWFGVSGTLEPGEQMPYISSGGFGGAALIAIGVTLLISFEHTRDRDALAQVLAELDELRRRLDEGPRRETPGDREAR